MSQPARYVHDCDQCIYLGRSSNDIFDLYFHHANGELTIIARFSDRPADYKSGLAFREIDPDLAEAYRMAEIRDLTGEKLDLPDTNNPTS